VDLTTGLESVGKRKEPHHFACGELNPGRLVRSLVTILTELPCLLRCNEIRVSGQGLHDVIISISHHFCHFCCF
jgi:hypothetical protein